MVYDSAAFKAMIDAAKAKAIADANVADAERAQHEQQTIAHIESAERTSGIVKALGDEFAVPMLRDLAERLSLHGSHVGITHDPPSFVAWCPLPRGDEIRLRVDGGTDELKVRVVSNHLWTPWVKTFDVPLTDSAITEIQAAVVRVVAHFLPGAGA